MMKHTLRLFVVFIVVSAKYNSPENLKNWFSTKLQSEFTNPRKHLTWRTLQKSFSR